MGNFYMGAAVDDIKGQHSHLMSDEGQALRIASLDRGACPSAA